MFLSLLAFVGRNSPWWTRAARGDFEDCAVVAGPRRDWSRESLRTEGF